MNFFKNLGEAVDIFKSPLNMSFFSKEKVSTTFNKLMSLIFFAILMVDFSQSDFFKKQHPKLTDRIYDNKGASLELSKMNFGLNLWIIDKDWYYAPLDPSYISLEVSQVNYDYNTGIYNSDHFILENCTDAIFEHGFCTLI